MSQADGPSSINCGSNSIIAAVRNTCNGFANAKDITNSAGACARMIRPNKIKSRKSSNISQTKNAPLCATSEERVRLEIKKPIPKKQNASDINSAEYHKKWNTGTSAPRIAPQIIAATIASNTGANTVMKRPANRPQYQEANEIGCDSIYS